MAAHYGKREYWDDRYSRDPDPFDWYQRYSGIKKFLSLEYLEGIVSGSQEISEAASSQGSLSHVSDSKDHFPSKDHCRVLIIGCGTSRLGEDLLMDGWNGGIYQIDYSSVVIKIMESRYDDEFYQKLDSPMDCRNTEADQVALANIDEDVASERSPSKKNDQKLITKMCFECLDITERLPFDDSFFDLIICKGALDSILCSDGAIANTRRMMHECARLLNDRTGALFCVSHGAPNDRLMYFENDRGALWKGGVNVYTVPKPKIGTPSDETSQKNDHYIYIAHKKNYPPDLVDDVVHERDDDV